jgi:hypothetical protein
MRYRQLLAIVFAAGIIASLPGISVAEFYRYVTRDGQIFYVDDLSKVPEEYLEQLTVYPERYDHLTEEERALMLQKERELDAQRELEEQERREQRRKQEARKRWETDVIIQGNQVLVPVVIGVGTKEIEALFLLDTGASQLVLFKSFAEQLNAKTERSGMSMVAGGTLIQTGLTTLDYVRVGPLFIRDAPASIIKQEIGNGDTYKFQGLLGMNVLRNMQYTIDFDNQKIRWRPGS